MSADAAFDAVTVTLNPAIDLTVTVDRLTVGHVQRAAGAVANCGGKGVNVAGCLSDWGAKVAVAGVLGRSNDGAFLEFFAAKRVSDLFVRTAGDTRTNIKIADRASGETTDVNLPGLEVSEATFDAARAAVKRSVAPGRPAVLAGSLPESLSPSAWGVLAGDLAASGALVVLDTSGAPLKAALASGQPIHAVKPNRAELEALIGRPLPTLADLIAGARGLLDRVALVVVSLGAEGALFVDQSEAITAALPAKKVLSTVGAGDAMVAGIAAALIEKAPLERIARLSVAFATSKLDRIGPYLGPTEDVERLAAAVRVTTAPI
jgi:1-phosphofructokinase